jgi:hypothetical protein
MKKLILLMLAFVSIRNLSAEDVFIVSQEGFVKIAPVYQTWSMKGNTVISEFSVPVSLYTPLGKNTNLNLYMTQATATGDSLEKLGGFGDPQLTLGHYFEPLRMNFSFGVNLPLGRKKMTFEEFGTLYRLSLSTFRFQTPSFGQGWTVSPGVAWAFPLNESLVAGFGVSYQYRGPFQPF